MGEVPGDISFVLVLLVDNSFAWPVDASQLMGPDLAFLHKTMQKHLYSQKENFYILPYFM
jgi:hypothetical protein